VEVTGMPMDAVRVKEELRLLRDHPAQDKHKICQNLITFSKDVSLQVS
jgi:hypothetical protein